MTWKYRLIHFYRAWGRNPSHCPLREMNGNEIGAFLLMSQGSDDLSEDLSYRVLKAWKLSDGFTCLLRCLILFHGLLTFSKAHIPSKTHLYTHGAAGCHSPSCAGRLKTMGKKLSLKILATYFIFSASGEALCSKTCAVPHWQIHMWTPVLLHGEWAAISPLSMHFSFIFLAFLGRFSCEIYCHT